jgi:lipopolysaccharide transport system ATP-binding protein
MSNVVIKVEDISKQYRLGLVGSGTLRDDLIGWWHSIQGKENPLLKIGETNERDKASKEKYVWSLKDINFEINQGDVVGIIGKNGAGKSTLLKILSKVTAPTTGSVKTKGKIASLLEVGTGFHPELTGKENIYLNGAILGMRKHEITRKLDEIIEFAGVERYIDTPVKRFSSGMYVRLAFAVAAHLDSDILIVDEVLAVGDADFQKKCLGKMQDLSKGQGRTVLFVSHNMDSINRLCSKTIYLKSGRLKSIGYTKDIVQEYLSNESQIIHEIKHKNCLSSDKSVEFLEYRMINSNYESHLNFNINEDVGVEMIFKVNSQSNDLICGINVFNQMDLHLFSSHDTINFNKNYFNGIYKATVWIPKNTLNEGPHFVSVALMNYQPFKILIHDSNNVGFNISDKQDGTTSRGEYTGVIPGVVRPFLKWDTIKKQTNQ